MESENKKRIEGVTKELNKGTRRLAKKREPCYSFNLIIVHCTLFRLTHLFTTVSGVFLPDKLAE